MYSVDGVFVASLADKPDSVIDLAGAYVVPPFADAHNHNVEFYGDSRARAVITKYLREGVFYDQNPLTLERARAGMTGLVNVPTSLDVIWAVGGLTGRGEHPTGLFLRNLRVGVFTAGNIVYLSFMSSAVSCLFHQWSSHDAAPHWNPWLLVLHFRRQSIKRSRPLRRSVTKSIANIGA